MNARALLRTSRVIRPSTRCLVLQRPMQRRFASSEQQPSHLSQFYKTFTRPVAKVLLMAVLTYQMAYWAWVKLETDEIMAEREAYIAELDVEVLRLTAPEPPMDQPNRIQEYQMQLMLLEERNKRVLAEQERMKEQETSGQKTSDQKTSPWWKVW